MSNDRRPGDPDNDETDAVVVTIRCKDMEFPHRGSTRHRCYTCREEVWLTPVTKKMIEDDGHELFTYECTRCHKAKDDPTKGFNIRLPSLEQMREFFDDVNDPSRN